MSTHVLMKTPIPEWAQQIQNVTGRRGAFHLPLLGVLSMEPPTDRNVVPSFGWRPVWLFLVVLVAAGLAGAVYFGGNFQGHTSETSSESSDGSDFEVPRKH